jgi:hypothetical protein
VELGLSNYPGFFATSPPGGAQAFGVFWPALVPVEELRQVVVMADGTRLEVPTPDPSLQLSQPVDAPATPLARPDGPTTGEPLGRRFGARSGDKGPNANLGVWATDEGGYAWLVEHLTPAALERLLPETAGLGITRAEFPHLLAVNFVIERLLGEGVASSTAFDPQAKGLGEYLRSRRWSVT